MRTFEPIGKYHAQSFMINGHHIEKVWKRVSYDKFIFDAVYDTCQDLAFARRRILRYALGKF